MEHDKTYMQWLFICTGNTCRSAMAEGILRAYLAEKLSCHVDELDQKGYKVRSAGTMNLAGVPASTGATAACAERGIDLGRHRSSEMSKSLIQESDIIWVMARNHREGVLTLYPDAAQKCMLLDPAGDIADPVGQPLDVFRRCADQIEGAIRLRMSEFDI